MENSYFRRTITLILLLGLSNIPRAQGEEPDPESWYRMDYGSLWDTPYKNMAAVPAYYHPKIDVHEANGEILTVDTSDWVSDLFAEWKTAGWIRSAISDVRTTRINTTTVSFIARWADWYEGAEPEYSCGWYLADLIDGKWRFTQYAPIDCAEHGYEDPAESIE